MNAALCACVCSSFLHRQSWVHKSDPIWTGSTNLRNSSRLQRMVTNTFEKHKRSRNASMTHPEFWQQFRRLCPGQIVPLISETKSDLLAQLKNPFEIFLQNSCNIRHSSFRNYAAPLGCAGWFRACSRHKRMQEVGRKRLQNFPESLGKSMLLFRVF